LRACWYSQHKIKAWPEERYAEVISWIESKYNLRTLLIGHEKEEEKIKKVYALANNRKTKVSVWLGKDGEIPLLALLVKKLNFISAMIPALCI